MTNDQLPRYRYWGDRKPNARLATLAVATARSTAVNRDGTPVNLVEDEEQPTVAVLRVYAPIDSWGGYWGINAEEFSAALDQLPASIETLILRINSPGGEVPEAMTILNMVRAHKARSIAVVDGWAVSAASFLAVGCDETVMSPGTQMMIHDARIYAFGDPASLRKTADRLDTDSDNIASIYAAAAGGTETDWRALMAPETWYTAKETVAAGLADRVDVVPDAGVTDTPGAVDPADPLEEGGAFDSAFDLSMYRYAGRNQAPAPAAIARPTKPPSASAVGSTKKEGAAVVDFNDEQINTLREQVGFPENADAATIVTATVEALSERATEDASKASAAAAPEGKLIVSKAEWDELRGDAQRGSKAAERLHKMERKTALDQYRDRYLPANRESWEKEYDLNPKATVEALKNRPVVIPLDELGHGVDEDTSGDPSTLADVRESPTYKNWSM